MNKLENAMKTYKEILYSSKEYEFRGSKLILTGYWTGKRVVLDMSQLIDTEMLEEMLVIEEGDYEDEEDE